MFQIFRFLYIFLLSCQYNCGFYYLISPLFQNAEERPLPFPIWTPFEIRGISYWILYIWQLVCSLFPALTVNASFFCLIIYFIMQTCSQFDVLTLRLISLPKIVKMSRSNKLSIIKLEKILLAKCIEQHKTIIK